MHSGFAVGVDFAIFGRLVAPRITCNEAESGSLALRLAPANELHHLIEAAPAQFSVFDHVELKAAGVFRGRLIKRFAEKPSELGRVVGVTVDCGIGQVTDRHVLGHTFDRTGMQSV